ncbi:MAG: FtsW/RodA/SpoVE family cell cycle protein [Lachnospiraceae bacterium]|nr:FtsW/RodA/SpoVE family cell cycle protein [Lachnospiraceae bacterium]
MERIIIEISRYLMIICMSVYTIQCFAVFRFGNEYDRKGIYLRQNFFMVFIHFLGFLSLYAQKGDIRYLRAYLIQQIGILAILAAYRLIYPRANTLIINNMCMLITIGLLILTRISYNKAMRQFYIVLGSAAVTLIVPFIISRIRFFEKFKWAYVIVGIGSLMAVLAFSTVINGSKLNIHIASYTFQPSEYVKIIFVFAIASILSQSHRLKDILISAAIAAVHVLLLVASKDLGSAIIFFVVYFAMLYAASRNILYYLIGFLAGGVGAYAGYKLFRHVRVRVTAFLDPMGNITDAGYQIAQSLFAIGTGGWLGMGIGQGAPDTIPVVAADFVFAAICEELGVVFGMCLILLCLSCFIMFMNIAMKFEDPFFKLVALGLSVSYIFQVFLTVGGVIKFIPLTGVTLPLVSYGGTSVAVTCCVFAVIQGLYISKGKDNQRPVTPDDFKTEKLAIVDLG